MNTPLAYLNGRFLPFAEAALPLHDAGFVSGATIVDNARTFRHKLFRWSDHLARFRRDCEACYVPLDTTDEFLTATAEELIAHNTKQLPPGGELQLVTFATPGPLGFYLGETTNGPAALGMVTYPLPFGRYRRFFTEGVTLAMAGRHGLTATDILPPAVKHRSRLHWYMAEQMVRDPINHFGYPGAVPVLMDGYGAADTAVACILAVADGAVYGPEVGSVQESISLGVVEELCGRIALPFQRARLDMYRLCRPVRPDDADPTDRVSEMFLAGTGFCAAGVKEFALFRGTSRGYTWPGPVFQKLLGAWSDLVGVDIAKQFTEAGA